MGGRSEITSKSYKDKGFEGESLDKHYGWHKDEFGGVTKTQYNKSAIKFKNSKNKNTFEYFRKNGQRVRYNNKTNEFIVVKPDGEITTYFKPTSNKYYERDKLKYE